MPIDLSSLVSVLMHVYAHSCSKFNGLPYDIEEVAINHFVLDRMKEII